MPDRVSLSEALVADIRDHLLRVVREHEEEWLGIEAESLLKRMKEEERRGSS